MIIFDMDGTLTLVEDRLKYLNETPKNWDAFYKACGEDKPNTPIIDIMIALRGEGHHIKIVTGRRESVRNRTLNWLWNNHIQINSLDLYMRPNGDKRHDIEVKPELIKSFQHQVEMIFEDRTSMVNKWRELGFTCLQVAKGDF